MYDYDYDYSRYSLYQQVVDLESDLDYALTRNTGLINDLRAANRKLEVQTGSLAREADRADAAEAELAELKAAMRLLGR